MMTEVSEVTMSERGFRYDAVITISEDVTLIVENKPRIKNVWKEQLNPNLSEISRQVKLIKFHSVVEWKKS